MFKNALKLRPFLYPYRWGLTGSIMSGVMVALLAPILPFFLQVLIDALSGNNFAKTNSMVLELVYNYVPREQVFEFFGSPYRVVKMIAYMFPVYFFVYGYFRFQNSYHGRYIAERVVNDLRYAIMDRLLSLNANFYSKTKAGSGGLLSRTLNDTMVMQQGMNNYIELLREPLIAICLISYMFYLNWKLSLFCMIFAPIISTAIRRISKALKTLATESQDRLDIVTKNLKEGLDGIRVIQSYNNEDHMRQKFYSSIEAYNSVRRKVILRMELASPLNELIVSFAIAGILVFVGNMIFAGEENLGQFIAFIGAAGALNKPLKTVQQAYVSIQQTEASIERIFEIIDSPEVVAELPPAQQTPFPQNWSTIEFRNVGFRYKADPILKNINLKVQRGEIIALVGESGSGKSTLVNLLERFFDPTEGEILVDGININRFSLKDLRDQIALVTQDVFLFNESVQDNIHSGDKDFSFDRVREATSKANALKFIERVPDTFNAVVGERGSNFSGGEKQRLSIARAIYKDAPILILDEATSALDSASEVEVQKGIQSLMTGRTAFIIAHRLSTISSSHRIIVMQAGAIVEQGTHGELLAQQGLYHYYQKLQEHKA